jgi:hypothetical protein
LEVLTRELLKEIKNIKPKPMEATMISSKISLMHINRFFENAASDLGYQHGFVGIYNNE